MRKLISMMFFSCFVSAEHADLNFFDNKDILTIATGNESTVMDSPATTYIITKEDIKRLGAMNLSDVMKTVPSVFVATSSVTRLKKSYSVRGSRTTMNPQVLVLKNGMPISDILIAAKPFQADPSLVNVKQIEVMIGPASIIYGANAYSAVINVITTPELEDTFVFRKHELGHRNSWLSVSSTENDKTYALSINHDLEKNDPSRIVERDLQTILDGIFSTNVSNAPSPVNTTTETNTINASYSDYNSSANAEFERVNGSTGIGIAGALSPESWEKNDFLTLQYRYGIELSHLSSIEFDLNHYQQNLDTYFQLLPSGSIIFVDKNGNLTVNRNSANAIIELTDGYIGSPSSNRSISSFALKFSSSQFENHEIFIKTGFSQEKVDAFEKKNFGPSILDSETLNKMVPDTNTYPDYLGTYPKYTITKNGIKDVSDTPYLYLPPTIIRNNPYATIQDIIDISQNLSFTVGFRLDYYSDINKSVSTPKAALVYQQSGNTVHKLIYAIGHRAPSFQELYIQNNPAANGNANVDVEKMESLEYVFRHRFSESSEGGFSVYKNNESQLIAQVAAIENYIPTSINLSNIGAHGAELLYSYSFQDETRAEFSLSWNDRDSFVQQNIFLDSPEWLAKASFFKRILNDGFINLSADWSSDIESDDHIPSQKNTGVLNIDVRYQHSIQGDIELSFGVSNMLNRKNHQYIELPVRYISSESRNFYIEFKKNF